MKRYVSSPASSLIAQSGLSPDYINAALENLVWGKGSAILRSNHPLLQRIRQATEINVVQVSRRSRYLLMQIEQHKEGTPSWQYRELTPRNCIFSCRGQLPAAIEIALNGELFEKLVKPAIAMDDTVIERVGDTGDGWLSVDVTPAWHLF